MSGAEKRGRHWRKKKRASKLLEEKDRKDRSEIIEGFFPFLCLLSCSVQVLLVEPRKPSPKSRINSRTWVEKGD